MILSFNPQSTGVKERGRTELARAVGLPEHEAAPFYSVATPENFQQTYNAFVNAFPAPACAISRLRPDGVGPGEMVAWFVFGNLQLGGRRAGIDLLLDGRPFAEMKGGAYTRSSGTLDNFKITRDGDPAVQLLANDLLYLNETHRLITGQDLPNWSPGRVGLRTLRLWECVDLAALARQFRGSPRARMYVPLDTNGDLLSFDGSARIAHWDEPDGLRKLKALALAGHEVPVDNTRSTLQKIINRWREQAFVDYLDGKTIALVNKDTLRMLFFGQLTRNMVGLYCVGRNQPWARVYLP